MARPVYSLCFIRASHVVGAANLTYTVPVNKVAVIKFVAFQQFSVSTIDTMQVWSVVAPAPASIINIFQLGAAATLTKNLMFECSVAVPQGGQIGVAATGTAGHSHYFTVSGYLLDN